jgi:chitin disaccharide deacetylase
MPAAMKYLIVNADDFGASNGINRGILEAHQRGIVTSTSLMVNMPAANEAVVLSRGAPDLSVGLHVNFTNEGDDPVVDLADSDACRIELQRQFQQFGELMGRLPTHLDSHQNVHRRPHLLPHFLDLAARYDLPMREHSRVRYFKNFYGQWGDGETHLEWISCENLLRMLASELHDGFTELGCHPGYFDPQFQSVYHIERETELQTLCDPALRRQLAEWQVKLIRFGEVSAASATS